MPSRVVQYKLFWITVWITAQSKGPCTGVAGWLWKLNLGFILGAVAVDTRSAARGPLLFCHASYRVFPRLEGSKFNSLTIG